MRWRVRQSGGGRQRWRGRQKIQAPASPLGVVGDEAAAVATPCTRSSDTADDDHDEGEGDQDPMSL